jgi:CspA family cold shock protein
VTVADGSGDAFLPGRVLSGAGYTTVASGASLRVRLGQGQKGPQVAELLAVDESTAQPQAPRRAGPGASPRPYGGGGSRGPAPTEGEDMRGTVKWFNQSKGFGFITPETGGKDVFVHVSVLNRSGVAELSEGQVVRVRVAQGAKGPEASFIELP